MKFKITKVLEIKADTNVNTITKCYQSEADKDLAEPYELSFFNGTTWDLFEVDINKVDTSIEVIE